MLIAITCTLFFIVKKINFYSCWLLASAHAIFPSFSSLISFPLLFSLLYNEEANL
jgi:hypothetical protein